ncbi:transcriptional regulator, TetR family [Pseudobutyrivibrio ruminis]|uniref:Transcriptional regulator, TetR family n=1 Tax=Pseudobutyrivibrio ruminis TaxID=46206 RepID=A0A1H7J1K8_9FIRM|nr:TetR/AcrR family transcriptional regulator [Pseudobutyrivibrio ruminis]SEK68516.1 transcriptional regulator, TetR family [Pseudobutyrivibrio ruminis]
MNKNESKYFKSAEKMHTALISLIDEKDFELITVKEICEVAGVNRSTFYLHYDNTNDLLKETIEAVYKDFFSRFGVSEEEQPFIMIFYLNGIIGLINEWLARDCAQSKEEIISIIQKCILRPAH